MAKQRILLGPNRKFKIVSLSVAQHGLIDMIVLSPDGLLFNVEANDMNVRQKGDVFDVQVVGGKLDWVGVGMTTSRSLGVASTPCVEREWGEGTAEPANELELRAATFASLSKILVDCPKLLADFKIATRESGERLTIIANLITPIDLWESIKSDDCSEEEKQTVHARLRSLPPFTLIDIEH